MSGKKKNITIHARYAHFDETYTRASKVRYFCFDKTNNCIFAAQFNSKITLLAIRHAEIELNFVGPYHA